MTLCVYALTSSSPGRLSVRGLEHERLRTIAVGAIAAVVGRVRHRPEASRELLARYHQIEERLAAGMTMLPARFGTTVTDDAELTAILRARHDSIRPALARVRGRAQMTVRVVLAAAPRQQTRRPTGAEYLVARAAIARAGDVPAVSTVRAAVARWVRDERVEARDRVVTIYHLIPRGMAGAYTRGLRAAAARAGLAVVVSGPWAPYAFSEA